MFWQNLCNDYNSYSHNTTLLTLTDVLACSDLHTDTMSLVLRKPVFGVSDQVPHKPGCTATEDGGRLEILDLGRREILLSV